MQATAPIIFPNHEKLTEQLEATGVAVLIASMSCELPVLGRIAENIIEATDISEDNWFIFESREKNRTDGRYSILGFAPDLIIKGDKNLDGIAILRKQITNLEKQIQLPDFVPQMLSGIFGYISYDMARQMEKLPNRNHDELNIPQLIFIRPSLTVIFDHEQKNVFIAKLITEQSDNTYLAAVAELNLVAETISRATKLSTATNIKHCDDDVDLLNFISNHSRDEYKAKVLRAKEYIAAGDIFQVLPSQRFVAPFTKSPLDFYLTLAELNPSPFLFLLKFKDFALVGSSPEILVRLKNNRITIRPLAGTRPRGMTQEEDVEFERNLLTDEKEAAEHLMLIDLARNDVGRVAKIGTVVVTEQMAVERYSHVMHLSSNVEGELLGDKTAIDALIAGFPAGTVSGAPKIRAMEIIDELEDVERSFYGGAVGYFAPNGDMDNCITLRTALLKDGKIYIQSGGGVVAGSDPDSEYNESVNKAKALMKAATIASRKKKKAIKLQSPELVSLAIKTLEDGKAIDVVSIQTEGDHSLVSYVVIATGNSKRHVLALTDQLQRSMRSAGMGRVKPEGMLMGEWVLLDFGDVMIHLLQPSARESYKLEEIIEKHS